MSVSLVLIYSGFLLQFSRIGLYKKSSIFNIGDVITRPWEIFTLVKSWVNFQQIHFFWNWMNTLILATVRKKVQHSHMELSNVFRWLSTWDMPKKSPGMKNSF